jgi:hypothetical protein
LAPVNDPALPNCPPANIGIIISGIIPPIISMGSISVSKLELPEPALPKPSKFSRPPNKLPEPELPKPSKFSRPPNKLPEPDPL